MIIFLPPPPDTTMQDARIWAINEARRLKVAGYSPETCITELERIGLPQVRGRWCKVVYALMIERLANR